MEIIEEVARLVEEECKKDSNLYGYSNSWKHINHVVELSRLFIEEEEGDKEIVELAAWLHDWSAIQGFNEDHHIRGASATKEILEGFGYPADKISQVQLCILSHRSSCNIPRRTREAECVASADAVAHYLEIPDLLCARYAQDGNVAETVVWLREKLERDLKKITIPIAKVIVKPYVVASLTILGPIPQLWKG